METVNEKVITKAYARFECKLVFAGCMKSSKHDH